LVTPLGSNTDETWNALLDGRAIGDHSQAILKRSPDMERVAQLALHASREAIAKSGWTESALWEEETALIVGTSKGPIESWLRGPAPSLVNGIADTAARVAQALQMGNGPRLTVSAACASGLVALAQAAMLLRSGIAQRALVIGVESSLHLLFQGCFQRLGVLAAADLACRPFDQDRTGFFMSEAAAAVCLEAGDSRKAISSECSPSPGIPAKGWGGGFLNPLTPSPTLPDSTEFVAGRNTGGGERMTARPASDPPQDSGCLELESFAVGGAGVHLTSGDPMGATLRYLLRGVVADHDVDLVHAHGTGTISNDATELAALGDVLLSQDEPPILYSHKAALGHSLGASGLVSVVLNCLMHREGVVPGNVNTPCAVEASKLQIAQTKLRRSIRRSIAIASGFGGSTVVVSLSSDSSGSASSSDRDPRSRA
jgi:3-oxoacyl-[acyl-carrier-protein] synthase II